MVSFAKVCHLGAENGTSFGNRVFVDGTKGLEMRSSWTRVALDAMTVSLQDTEETQTQRRSHVKTEAETGGWGP
jgi:hypothetical protein